MGDARRRTLVGLWYAAVTALLYAPLLGRLTTTLHADVGDGAIFAFYVREVPSRLLHLEDPFRTDAIFHPVGADLAFNASIPLVGVLVAALTPLVGPVLAFNLLSLLGSVATGALAHAVARRETASTASGLVAGTLLLLLPARIQRSGTHLNFFHLEVLLALLWALSWYLDRPSGRRAVVVGGLVGLGYLEEVTWGLVGAGVVLVVGVVEVLRKRTRWPRPAELAAAGAAALVGAAPLLLAQARALRQGDSTSVPGLGGAERFSSDLLSWVVPPFWHPLWGRIVESPLGQLNRGEQLAYPGVALVALAVLGVAARGGRARAWGAAALSLVVLSLGPVLKVAGRTGSAFEVADVPFTVPLPFLALRSVPGLEGLRAPGRFAIAAGVLLALVAAHGLAWARARSPRAAVALPVLVLLVALVDTPPVPDPYEIPAAIPEPYHAIGADPGPGAVLEVPVQWQDGFRGVGRDATGQSEAIFLYWNRYAHKRPVVNGFSSRLPDRRVEALSAIPPYRRLLELEGEPGVTGTTPLTVAQLQEHGIGFVVIHRDRPVPAAVPELQALGLPVLADDGTVLVWRVPPP